MGLDHARHQRRTRTIDHGDAAAAVTSASALDALNAISLDKDFTLKGLVA